MATTEPGYCDSERFEKIWKHEYTRQVPGLVHLLLQIAVTCSDVMFSFLLMALCALHDQLLPSQVIQSRVFACNRANGRLACLAGATTGGLQVWAEGHVRRHRRKTPLR